MYGKASILALLFLVSSSFDFKIPGLPVSRILQIYHRADLLFHLPNSTPANDSTALAAFQQVIDELIKILYYRLVYRT